MNKSVWMISKVNLKNIKAPYVITGVVFLLMLAQDVIKTIIAMTAGMDMSDDITISIGNMLWLLIPLAAIFIATKNFYRIMNLGGKRKNYFWGSFITYVILAGAVSFANTLIYYTYDRIIINMGYYGGVENLLEVFGWYAHGPIIAFLQQFAFLLLFAVFTHTLTAMQDKWYGWVTDIVIIAIISVFTPIAPLRAMEVKFFNLIIFQPNAFLQMIACLLLAALIYAISLPVFNRKSI